MPERLHDILGIAPGHGHPGRLLDGIEQLLRAIHDERLEIVLPQELMVNPMCLDDLVQVLRCDGSRPLQTSEILRRRIAADGAIRFRGNRRFVHDAVPLRLFIMHGLRIGTRENVMDIHIFIREAGEVYFNARDEIAALVLQDERHDALVGRRLARLHAEQPARIEIRIRDRLRQIAALDPSDHLHNIVGIARLVRRAIQLAEDAAPIPAAHLVAHDFRHELMFPREHGADGSERYQLRRVRQVFSRENALLFQEIPCEDKAFAKVIRILLIVLERQVQHVLLLAADRPPAGVGREQRQRRQEIRCREDGKNLIREILLLPLLPVLAQREIMHGKHRCHELEDRQRNAARVDILEHLADRFLRRVLLQRDDRHRIFHRRHDELRAELRELRDNLRLELVIRIILVLPILPFHVIQDDIQWKQLVLEFLLSRRDIKLHRPAEIRRDELRRGNGADNIVRIRRRVQRLFDVEIIVPLDRLLLLRLRLDGMRGIHRIVKRRQALLPVKNQHGRFCASSRRRRTFDRLIAELDFRIPIFEEHRRAHGKIPDDAVNQRTNPPVIPDPAALEIRQLRRARRNFLHQGLQTRVM